MNRVIIMLFCFVISQTLSATIFIPIETTLLQKVTLSSNHQNRILVDGGRVLKVIYPDDGSISLTIEEESGQVFVHSMVPNPSTTTISVVTSTGIVQDIEVDFEKRSSEVIVLSLPVMKKEERHQSESCLPTDRCWVESSSPEAIQDKVNRILNGDIPFGYRTCRKKGPVRMLKKYVRVENISKISSDSEDLYVWRIENVSTCQTQKIWECELSFEGSSWIYIEKNCLNPGEIITAIVAVEK